MVPPAAGGLIHESRGRRPRHVLHEHHSSSATYYKRRSCPPALVRLSLACRKRERHEDHPRGSQGSRTNEPGVHTAIVSCCEIDFLQGEKRREHLAVGDEVRGLPERHPVESCLLKVRHRRAGHHLQLRSARGRRVGVVLWAVRVSPRLDVNKRGDGRRRWAG